MYLHEQDENVGGKLHFGANAGDAPVSGELSIIGGTIDGKRKKAFTVHPGSDFAFVAVADKDKKALFLTAKPNLGRGVADAQRIVLLQGAYPVNLKNVITHGGGRTIESFTPTHDEWVVVKASYVFQPRGKSVALASLRMLMDNEPIGSYEKHASRSEDTLEGYSRPVLLKKGKTYKFQVVAEGKGSDDREVNYQILGESPES
jgi:hypothetical protein